MLMHHTLDSAKSRLNLEIHWLVNSSSLLTGSVCKPVYCDKFVMHLCEPFPSGEPYFGAPQGVPCTTVEEHWSKELVHSQAEHF